MLPPPDNFTSQGQGSSPVAGSAGSETDRCQLYGSGRTETLWSQSTAAVNQRYSDWNGR